MIEYLAYLDQEFFFVLNELHHVWMDPVMYLISTKTFWIPAYLVLLYAIWKRVGTIELIVVIIFITLLITISDQTASGILKPWIQRLRPCRPENHFSREVHVVYQKCGGKFGFVSSHAANFFALATFLALLFNEKYLWYVFFSCAILVAYSRIYLGVHYPGDVLGGAIVGIIAALFIWILYTCTRPYFLKHSKLNFRE